jgi:hypothetical protein
MKFSNMKFSNMKFSNMKFSNMKFSNININIKIFIIKKKIIIISSETSK